MIDLHCHILPAIDDGASDLSMAMQMARMMVADGVETVACTPHILPGLYHNTGPQIRQAVEDLQLRIDEAGLPLRLTTGADVHLAPGLVSGLRGGSVLSIADTRYLLIEPPHHVLPARFDESLFELTLAGYVPIITHPERLSWLPQHYALIANLAHKGIWMQITAGSLTGQFGRTALYWAERMVDEGLVHLIASDAHDTSKRPPNLSAGMAAAERRVGSDEALALVSGRPGAILQNVDPASISPPGLGVISGSGPSGSPGKSRRGTGNVSASSDSHLSGTLRGIGRRLRRLIK